MAIRVTLSLNLKKSVVKPHTKGYREVGASSDLPSIWDFHSPPTDPAALPCVRQHRTRKLKMELQLRALLSFLPQQQGSHPPGALKPSANLSFFSWWCMDGTDPSRPGALHSRDSSSSSQTAGWFQACWNEPWHLCPHPKSSQGHKELEGHTKRHFKPHRLMLRIPFMTHPTPEGESRTAWGLAITLGESSGKHTVASFSQNTQGQDNPTCNSYHKLKKGILCSQGLKAGNKSWLSYFYFTFNYYPSTSLTPSLPALTPKHISKQSKKQTYTQMASDNSPQRNGWVNRRDSPQTGLRAFLFIG